MEANKKNASGGKVLTKTQFNRKAEEELTELRNEIKKTRQQVQALRSFFRQMAGAATN